jgi:hypothetical protein
MSPCRDNDRNLKNLLDGKIGTNKLRIYWNQKIDNKIKNNSIDNSWEDT